MDFDQDLKAKVDARALEHYETKAEIVQYYRMEYGKSWKQRLVHDLSPHTRDKKGNPMKPKNLERRFDPSRLGNPEKKNAKQYKDLGETLPPKYKLPITVHVSGEMRISRNCVPASFTVQIGNPGAFSLQGANAEEFVRNPTMWDLIVAYFEGDPDNPVEGWCSPPRVSVTG